MVTAVQQLPATSLADPFEVLIACDGNEALAAEQMGISVVEFYRALENSEPDRVHRGLAAQMAVTLSRVLRTVEGALIDRLNDQDNPLSDANLVALVTRGIPVMAELARSAARPSTLPGNNLHVPQEIPPAIQAILDKLADHPHPQTITAGGLDDRDD